MDVIIDIDGTIADCEHRRDYVISRPKNWKAFFDAMIDDTPILPVIEIVRSLHHAGHRILMVSGRPDSHINETQNWLSKHAIPYDRIYMRKQGDLRPDFVIKAELLNIALIDGFNPALAIDDRQSVVELWRSRGIICLQNKDQVL